MVEDIDEDGALETPEAVGDDVGALQAEIAALKEQVLRFAAEADNTKRRAEREANDARAFAIQRFAKDLFAAADNMSRALGAAPRGYEDPAIKNLILGIEMTEKALQDAFERNGLKKLEPPRGERFDPHRHQAVMEQAGDDVPPGSVVMVMQPGYELFGRVVRPAMVAVTPKAAASAATPAADSPAAAYPPSDADGAGGAIDTKA